jgi:uncharacterized protein (TIGR01777 family)
MKALVSGGSGFIGSALCARLQRPRVLSRSPSRTKQALGDVEPFPWDAEGGPPPVESVEGADAVFHLAGDPVAEGRWTAAKKKRIRDSRVLGTRHLVRAIAAAKAKPRVLVAFSAVGLYGDRGVEELTESSAPGSDFLAAVCGEWEGEAAKARDLGVRVVHLRIGVVLGPGGGALKKMLLPFRLGLGGVLGDGRQWMPWIHRDDVVGLALFAAEKESVSGAVNAVGPAPATNREFTKALGRALGRPTIFPVPRIVLRVAFGEMAAVLLGSQRVLPKAALAAGYAFRHPEVGGALRAILAKA